MVLGTSVGEKDATCITIEDELTYLLVLDSVSNEETERIVTELRGELIPDANYLWWENQKVGIIFLTVSFPDYDELAVCEANTVHCQYLSINEKSFLQPTLPSLGTASRVNVITTDEDNSILVSTSEAVILRGKFRKLYVAD